MSWQTVSLSEPDLNPAQRSATAAPGSLSSREGAGGRKSRGTVRDDGPVSARLAEPDYQLVWPRDLFIAESAKLLNQRELKDWDERCELLLAHAFVRGYEGGPLGEFCEIAVEGFGGGLDDPWGTSAPRPSMTARQQFLRNLMGKADQLREDASHRRPYCSCGS